MTNSPFIPPPEVSEFEQQVVHLMIFSLLAGGTFVGFIGGRPDMMGVSAPLSLTMYFLAGLVWAVNRWSSSSGFWFSVMSVKIVILVTYPYAGFPVLSLLAIPPLLCAASRSPLVMPAVGAISTAILFFLGLRIETSETNMTWMILIVFASLIWITIAITWLNNHSSQNLVHWAWSQYRYNQEQLDNARSQRVQLAQTIEDLAHANRQMALLNERLAIARRIAEDAERAKATFVANVSHEFRTPLNMIIGLTDLMNSRSEVYAPILPEMLLEDLRIVQRNCEHLAGMINDVLDLSQIEAEQMSLRRERVNLAEVAGRAVSIVLPLIKKKNLAIHTELPDEGLELYCDRTRIRQVIVNLLSNAARFTEQGGITVKMVRDGPNALISVQDTGPGISAADIERIFEPFYQSEGGHQTSGSGTGLGLSVCQRFVNLHHGRIWVESKEGVGSTFFVRLPINLPLELESSALRWSIEGWEWYQRNPGAKLPIESLKPLLVLYDETDEFAGTMARYSVEMELNIQSSFDQALTAAEKQNPTALVFNATCAEQLCSLMEQANKTLTD